MLCYMVCTFWIGKGTELHHCHLLWLLHSPPAAPSIAIAVPAPAQHQLNACEMLNFNFTQVQAMCGPAGQPNHVLTVLMRHDMANRNAHTSLHVPNW